MRLEHLLYTILLKPGSLFRRERSCHELDEELQDRFQRKEEKNPARGPRREEAHLLAWREPRKSRRAARSAGTCAA